MLLLKSQTLYRFLFSALAVVGLFLASCALAQESQTIADDSEISSEERTDLPRASELYAVSQLTGEQNFGDFVVGPGKFDLQLEPGQSEVVTITITNRTDEDKIFRLTTEDIEGSQDSEVATVLLGDDQGPYTLRDFLQVAADRFIIGPAERVTVPITVSLPIDAEPGGRYGSLLVQTASANNQAAANTPTTAIVSRIAVLFFVTTPGKLSYEGSLVDFATIPETNYFTSGPITFGLLYENTGTVHTNPAGEIIITNIFGDQVGYVEVTPWFALPQSLRLREVTWDRDNLLGKYTATARVYRGYGEAIDTKVTSFWVIDWKLIGIGVVAIVVLISAVRFFTSRFTLTRKDS